VTLYYGPLSGQLTTADADRTWSGLTCEGAGFALAAADFDGDGATDLAVGAPNSDVSAEGAGQLYLLWGPL
jgi:hypothetical protein